MPDSLLILKLSQVWEANWKGVISLEQEVVLSWHSPMVESIPSQTRARQVRLIIWRPRAGTRQEKLHLLTAFHAVQPAEEEEGKEEEEEEGGV